MLALLGMGMTPARAASLTAGTASDLISAIHIANANGEADVITLTANITLTAVDNTTDGANGLPVILADGGNTLTIDGSGFTIARDASSPYFRILYVDAGAEVVLKNITLSSGATEGPPAFGLPEKNGAGIYSKGTLTLNGSRLVRNSAAGQGGGVYNDGGSVSLLNGSTVGGEFGVDGNVANSGGGGLHSQGGSLLIDASFVFGNDGTGGSGGGLFVDGTELTIRNDSKIGDVDGTNRGNLANNAGGGIRIQAGPAAINITDSTIAGNFTSSILGGGGIAIFGSGHLRLENVLIVDNGVNTRGGGLLMQGGAVVEIIDSTIIDNAAGDGDAIAMREFAFGGSPVVPAALTVENSTIGGLDGSALRMETTAQSFIDLDLAMETNITLTNSTIAGFASSPAIHAVAHSELISPQGATVSNLLSLSLRNVSVAGAVLGISANATDSGSGTSSSIQLDVANSYIEGPAGTADCTFSSTSNSSVTHTGNNNLTTGTNCAGAAGFGFTTTTSAALNLGPLQDNGGPTPTVALGAGSIAIDGSGANATASDQRGVAAVSTRDIGAYEFEPPSGPAPAACRIYGVDDVGERDSQFFTITPNAAHNLASLGPLHTSADIESLDIDPLSGMIYATAGSANGFRQKGHLFIVDGSSGDLHHVAATGQKAIRALAFRPTDGVLWGWGADTGLITIDTTIGTSQLKFKSNKDIGGLAWSNDGTLLYAASGRSLFVYNPATNKLKKIASNLPDPTEGLGMRPDGLLALGVHDKTTLYAYNPLTRKLVASAGIDVPAYRDIEGIAWPPGIVCQGG